MPLKAQLLLGFFFYFSCSDLFIEYSISGFTMGTSFNIKINESHKIDKIKQPEQDKVLIQVRTKLAKHPAAFPELIITSSEKGEGIATLRAVIAYFE